MTKSGAFGGFGGAGFSGGEDGGGVWDGGGGEAVFFPDFVNAYPKNHQRIEVRYVDAVS